MPNWVRNEICMEDIEKSVLISKNEDGEQGVDFNQIIPMPKSLDVISGSMQQDSMEAVAYYMKECSLSSDMVREAPSKERVEQLAKKYNMSMTDLAERGFAYILNYIQYGSVDWYDWCNKHWGTKWNADTISIDSDSVVIDTAWDAPLPIIQKLSEIYPDKVITITWADEGLCHSGYAVYQKGYCVDGGYDETKEEADEHYEEVWGEPVMESEVEE